MLIKREQKSRNIKKKNVLCLEKTIESKNVQHNYLVKI